MTNPKLPNTTIRVTTANELGHRAEFTSRTGRPLPIIRLADGRELPVRGARFSPRFTTLLYTAGPSDTYRHDYTVDVLPDEEPCANCVRDLAEHDRDDLRNCQAQHLHHLGGQQ